MTTPVVTSDYYLKPYSSTMDNPTTQDKDEEAIMAPKTISNQRMHMEVTVRE